MSFKYPGHGVAVCTAIPILMGIPCIPVGISYGHLPWYMVVAGMVGFAALSMWFQVREGGIVFGIFTLAICILGALRLFLDSFSYELSVKVGAAAYSAWVSYEWVRDTEE